jgi:hypothetical protein
MKMTDEEMDMESMKAAERDIIIIATCLGEAIGDPDVIPNEIKSKPTALTVMAYRAGFMSGVAWPIDPFIKPVEDE